MHNENDFGGGTALITSLISLQECSITEAVEKQLQGALQPQLTPLMGKKTQMGTQVLTQEAVITPLSGK